ncbi:MAG: DUF427 domain-containing protein [Ilumatobacteraceae bacterium]
MALRFADHEFAALAELRWHPEAKRIRASVGGAEVISTTRARIVWEPRRVVPSFAVLVGDIVGSLVATGPVTAEEHAVVLGDGPPVLDPSTGFTFHTAEGRSFDIVTSTSTLSAAAFAPADADLDGYVIVDFDAFDEWREEDEVLLGHARDPFKTVDTRRSSRRVQVSIAGAAMADSTRSVMLFETYLPTRYYLPRADVRTDLLVPSATPYVCAYKGTARYWSAHVDDSVVTDVAWTYEDPHNYATLVKDMICFFNEQVDLSVDGEHLPRPRSPWSR